MLQLAPVAATSAQVRIRLARRGVWRLLAAAALLAAGCGAIPGVSDVSEPAAVLDGDPAASDSGSLSSDLRLGALPRPGSDMSAPPPVQVAPGASAEGSASAEAAELSSVDTASVAQDRPADAAGPVAAVALGLLERLAVAAEHPHDYDRDNFRHWIDADSDGCDTRREVLIAEAVTAPAVGGGCSLSGGSWSSLYDGGVEHGNGRGFDVDHMVPLLEAWESGAHAWSEQQREAYANDMGYEHSLVAVSASSNRSKSARDPAEWMPPDSGVHCWYAAAWVQVKARWSLSVDAAEAGALRSLLAVC